MYTTLLIYHGVVFPIYSSGSTDSIFGPVRNPWNYKFSQPGGEGNGTNDWHIAGGSSGGGAVAVATGTCFGYLCYTSINKVFNFDVTN